MGYTTCVRVAVSNNFNCTTDEFKQLDGFKAANPNSLFFVNCNAATPNLLKLNKKDTKVVVTINPNLTLNKTLVNRVKKLNPSQVAFVRVKYVPGYPEILELVDDLRTMFPVVITNQRFQSLHTLYMYTEKEFYDFSCSRFRLNKKEFNTICEFVDSRENVYICDRSGKGCQDCNLCSTLVSGEPLEIKSLNLSTSGICPFNCPDCYAKCMQKFLSGCGYPLINFDKIKKNHKQSGRTQHIKNAKTGVK